MKIDRGWEFWIDRGGIELATGDRFVIETPGGGGYGAPS